MSDKTYNTMTSYNSQNSIILNAYGRQMINESNALMKIGRHFINESCVNEQRKRKYFEDVGLFADEISNENEPARILKLLKAGLKEADERRDWGSWSDMIEAAIKNKNCDIEILEYLKPLVRNRDYLGDLLDDRMQRIINGNEREINEGVDISQIQQQIAQIEQQIAQIKQSLQIQQSAQQQPQAQSQTQQQPPVSVEAY